MAWKSNFRNPQDRRMLWTFFLCSSYFIAAAQSPTISSEGDPFVPVPAYEGYIVDNGRQSNNSANGASFVAAPGKIPKVDSVVVAAIKNIQPSVEGCSRSCAVTAGCSVFMYCEAGGGPCPSIFGVILPELGCGLLSQAESTPNNTLPFMVIAGQEATKYLISGAPIVSKDVENAVPLIGFTELFSQSFYNKYDYACDESLIDGACALSGTPQSLLKVCDDDPDKRCNIMVWYPAGRPDLGPNITFLKGGKGVIIDTSLSNLNHHGVSYARLGQGMVAGSSSGGSSRLSDAAVAGIAVACAVAGAILAAGLAALALKRSRQTQFLQLHTQKTDHDVELQRPNSQASTLMSSSAPSQINSVSGSSPPGSGNSAAKSAAEAQKRASPTVSPFVMAIPGDHASKSDSVFDIPTSPFQFPASSSAFDGAGTTIGTPKLSSTAAVSEHQQESLQQTEISILNSTDVLYASNSTDNNTYSRGVKSLDLQTAASTASVMEAIRGAGWAHYSVPFESIQWMRHPEDGSLWELGHGAFSKVYKCTMDHTLLFAAKVIFLGDKNDEHVFLREVRTLFHLRHPNVVQFSGVCIHEKNGILLMELVEGGSLFDNINVKVDNNNLKSGTASTGARITSWHYEGKRIALGIAQALHYLHHSLKVMHMDLKSANVLLTRDFTPKVADVGFSRIFESMDLSAKDSRIGTFAYMAPELLLGGSVTSSADIYSFGVLLRELCTGEYASRGRSRLPVPGECPQEVVDIIIACMKNEPNDRPTAKEVHAMLLKCPS